jgi:sterol desaturase/sphingolipid hydroxylase (fatty acid hydroxylase superfamily)
MILPLYIIPAIAVILWIARFYEKRLPAESEQSSAEIIMDWKLAATRIGLDQLISPIASASGIILVNAAGGGWIHLRSDGWWFLFSVMLFILASDLWGYLLHRAYHKFPVLWAMHSLHHSAEALSIITGARHFWLEDAINTAVFPVLGIIFKVPPEVVTTVAVIYILPEGLSHSNIRLSLRRFALCLNNPQYHRIHHSIEPQHQNKNFCKMFPLFDVLFGTAWKPGKDEFPMTGLVPRETATSFLDGIIWPVRRKLPVQRLSQLLLQVGRNTARLIPGLY